MPHITLQHIKGHQDRTTPYHELPLLAQLNVDADSKATQFQAQHGAPRPHIEPNARTQAFFFTSEGTITARYTSEIYTATSAPPLRQYLQQRNNWTASTMTSINWEAHKKAIKTTSLPKVHVVKLVHNIIPTNKQVYRQDKNRQSCPLCKTEPEIRDHIQKCNHISRQEWRTNLFELSRPGAQNGLHVPYY
jgi:hypothetical protein